MRRGTRRDRSVCCSALCRGGRTIALSFNLAHEPTAATRQPNGRDSTGGAVKFTVRFGLSPSHHSTTASETSLASF